MRFWYLFIGFAAVVALTNAPSVADRVQRIARAIATAEGYGVPGAIPTIRNNPGNIRSAAGPIATYPTVEAGWDALYRQVSRMLDGSSPYYPTHYTLAQVAKVYTGESAYMNWAKNVGRILGVSTDTIFSEIS